MLEYKPKIGQEVEVVIDMSESIRTSLVWRPPTIVIVGTVIASESYDSSNSFRLNARNHSIPNPVIAMSRVIGFKIIGSEINQATLDTSIQQEKDAVAFLSAVEARKNSSDPDAPIPVSVTEYKVTGSKGDLYTVSRTGDRWRCTCVAGLFGKSCKHAKKVEVLLSK